MLIWAKRNAAERLLIVFSRYRPAVGYCQGLNFVAAALTHLLDEASAFIVFCGLLERLPAHLYSSNPELLAKSRTTQQELINDVLAAERLDLAAHFHDLQLDLNLFLPRWLTCLFATVIPFRAMLRLWDYVLGDGGGDALPRLALALLCRAEAALLRAVDAQEALDALAAITSTTTPSHVDTMLCTEWRPDRLLKHEQRQCDCTHDLTEDASTCASPSVEVDV
jgi:GTPase-activating protein